MTSWPSARIDSLISFVFEVAKQAINKVILLNPSSTDYWLAKGQQKGGGVWSIMKNAPKNRGQVHLFLECLENILYPPFNLE